jgi:lysophospholipase L1-like esterase
MWSLGGRGGRVFAVTHLGDSGPGSLREAVEASGPRTVVFAVGGTIRLEKPLVVRQPRLTLAGQTAPGDGITLRGQPFEVAASDVVVRFIRARLGDEGQVDGDAIGIVAGQRIILDHVSASWSTDEVLSVSARFDVPERSFDEVTVQWALIGESLNRNAAKKASAKPGEAHGFGTLLRAAKGARVSFHHNVWLHHEDRMPRPGNWHKPGMDPVGGLFDFRNNVFYNWGRERAGYNLDRDTRSSYNFINNCYWRGPNSKGAFAFEESSPLAQAFFSGNTMDGQRPADPWQLVRAHAQHLPQGLPAGYKRREPLAVGPVADEPAEQACPRVLAQVGASLVPDSVDLRLLEDLRQRRGQLIDSQTEVGGWPRLATGPVPPDRDGDGLPDAWEAAHGLNPDDAADGARIDPRTGLTPLDRYLDELVAQRLPVAPGPAAASHPKASQAASAPGIGPPPTSPVAGLVGLPALPMATRHPALHLVGDSTMADKPLDPPNPERGWGQALRAQLAEPERLLNHAANGRSTRRFLAEGRWHHVLSQLAPGDWVLIQFGHNDARLDDPARYAAPDSSYPQLLERFIQEARARGATPLLATPVVRRQFDPNGQLKDSHGAYPEAMRQLAQRLKVPLLDMTQASHALVSRLGEEGSRHLFMNLPPGQWARYPQGLTDNTHFTEAGAQAMAELALGEMRRVGVAVAGWVKPGL